MHDNVSHACGRHTNGAQAPHCAPMQTGGSGVSRVLYLLAAATAITACSHTAPLTIHFSRGESTVAVSREAPEGGASLETALRELLRGPTGSERDAGIHSWFSPATEGALRSVTIEQERAIIDFGDLSSLIPNASTSAGSAMLLRELNGTVFEFPSVQSIEYRIEGSCERFWEWLQRGGCQIQERA